MQVPLAIKPHSQTPLALLGKHQVLHYPVSDECHATCTSHALYVTVHPVVLLQVTSGQMAALDVPLAAANLDAHKLLDTYGKTWSVAQAHTIDQSLQRLSLNSIVPKWIYS